MKKIKNFLINEGVTILLIIILAGLINSIIIVHEKQTIKYRNKVGTEFVLNNDTLKVIDYSYYMDNFTLSNGVIVNSTLIIVK